jgi:hypothetical protein
MKWRWIAAAFVLADVLLLVALVVALFLFG